MRELLRVHPERCSDEFLASHGISPEAAESLRNQNEARFLTIRRKTLEELDQRFIDQFVNEEIMLSRSDPEP